MKNTDPFEGASAVFINSRKEPVPVNTPCSVLAYEYPRIHLYHRASQQCHYARVCGKCLEIVKSLKKSRFVQDDKQLFLPSMQSMSTTALIIKAQKSNQVQYCLEMQAQRWKLQETTEENTVQSATELENPASTSLHLSHEIKKKQTQLI